jgi:RNA polymerase sigma-70 factor (ECF subfamily)
VVTDVAGGLPGPDVGIDLRQAIGRLPEADREVFLMREVVGLGHGDIAELVGATPASVRCRIYRARAALKSML